MPRSQPAFSIGDVVQRLNQPEAVGVVQEVHWDSQTESWTCIVQFGAQRRAVPEDLLQKFTVAKTPWDALREGKHSGIDHFIFTLTYHRLKNPPARIAHSFATARTQFYPHQFKPLLKFLDNPGKRLLIADDVGLGKTIEAGYILRELRAHGPIERVLILVPSRLAPKWKREMQSRFQETFEFIKGNDIISQAERIRLGRKLESFRWIVSYESARAEEVRVAIEEIGLPIDVLIADEAHRMRNPGTLQHKVGSALCNGAADSVIFLSATPVQNKLEDLWHLMRLLAADEFAEWPVFQQHMEANRLLLEAQRALAVWPSEIEKARDAINRFSRTRRDSSGKGTFLRSVIDRLDSRLNDRKEVVELQADIGRLSPVGHIICRTRKVEALVDRSVRDAKWKSVSLSQEERRIYDSVEGLCRASWPGVAESWGFQMSLLMAYRITASCVPAAMEYFAERLYRVSARALAEEIEEEISEERDDQHQDLTAWSGPTRERLREIVEFYRQSMQVDSKLSELLRCLKEIWADDDEVGRPRRKIVIFSFFRRTLEYLTQKLSEREIANRMIHGGIPINDREIAIDDFLESPEIKVLLTSEVGGEGLDLQRASVVVNYDLPWNPMVVEQRIGRVDRIGQEAKIIHILNLVVENSIEERVLQRLLEKIDIFRDSIGELDEIIGDEIERITAQALKEDLSDEKLQQLIEQRGDSLRRRVNDAKTILSRVDGLLAADQALIDEINSVVGERQIPAEKELLHFLNRFLASRYPGCQIPREAVRKVVEVNLRQLAPGLEAYAPNIGADGMIFARQIGTGPISLTLSREAGYTHSRVELIHLQHPLTRYALAEVERVEESHQAAFAISLTETQFPSGDYAFLLATVHINSHRPTTKLVAVIADRNSDWIWNDPDETTRVLVDLLDHGKDFESPPINPEEFERLKDRLRAGFDQLRAAWDAKEGQLDKARREQQYISRRTTLEFLVQKAQGNVDNLLHKRAADFAIRMARARLEKSQRELNAFLNNPPTSDWGGIEYDEIAVGLLQIETTP